MTILRLTFLKGVNLYVEECFTTHDRKLALKIIVCEKLIAEYYVLYADKYDLFI